MERPGDLEQKYAAALAEQVALKLKLRALEEENAALKVRRAELERLEQAVTAAGDHQATDLEGAPHAKGPRDPGGRD
jgi:regulator of replication initiation timing